MSSLELNRSSILAPSRPQSYFPKTRAFAIARVANVLIAGLMPVFLSPAGSATLSPQIGGAACDCPAADSYSNTTGGTVTYVSIVKHDAECTMTCHTGTDNCYVDVTFTLGAPCISGPFTLNPTTACEDAAAQAKRAGAGALTVTVVCGEWTPG